MFGDKKWLEAALSALLIIDAATMILAAFRAPFPGVVPLGSPTAYRNIYIHVPVSIASYTVFTASFIAAILYLVRGEEKYERMSHASIVVGVILGTACLVTGMIWASESWGSPWNWDPRETGVFMMWAAYLVYFVLRSSISDPDLAPRISMAYAVAAFATIPLGFALPYMMPSLHPITSQTAGFLRGETPSQGSSPFG